MHQGLSPRVRGNRRSGAGMVVCAGSIPACAREPHFPTSGRRSRTVYPRVCGGTIAVQVGDCADHGLSPRVRGNQLAGSVVVVHVRSIPACAGEPLIRVSQPIIDEVYPRVCGGTRCHQRGLTADKGLSPRVRGNLDRRQLAVAQLGSIPACAGEPDDVECEKQPAGVYPRVCGGTRGGEAVQVSDEGLSPRVRGNPWQTRSRPQRHGSIPACAGEPRPNG